MIWCLWRSGIVQWLKKHTLPWVKSLVPPQVPRVILEEELLELDSFTVCFPWHYKRSDYTIVRCVWVAQRGINKLLESKDRKGSSWKACVWLLQQSMVDFTTFVPLLECNPKQAYMQIIQLKEQIPQWAIFLVSKHCELMYDTWKAPQFKNIWTLHTAWDFCDSCSSQHPHQLQRHGADGRF